VKESLSIPLAQLLYWNLEPKHIQELRSRTAEINPFETSLSYFAKTEKFQQIKFNVRSLDELTEGGIDVGSITEIYGEAGSGKSQLCMQLAVNVQLPLKLGGLNGKALYISTDKTLSINRLNAMAESLKVKHCNVTSVRDINFLDNIFVAKIDSMQEVDGFLQKKLPRILSLHSNVRLIIFDSIAGIFRMENNFFMRARIMRYFVHELERLAEINNFAIVTTNQVTSIPQDSGGTKDDAALGSTWDSLVVTKLKVNVTSQFAPSRVRTLEVEYSPRLPCEKSKFIITSAGIEQIVNQKK
jgi:RecA/RadA recombinase